MGIRSSGHRGSAAFRSLATLSGTLLTACASAPAAPGPANPCSAELLLPVPLCIDSFRLPNGLQVILAPDATLPVVAVNVWYRVGSADELPGERGLAHLVEHLMFERGAPGGDGGFASRVERAGGIFNASTDPDRTSYFQIVPPVFLEQALELEADRMHSPVPADLDEALQRQRRIIGNERAQHYDDAPLGRVSEVITAALFPHPHPYAHPPIGQADEVQSATREQVRRFAERFYGPGNAVLSVVGAFDAEAIRHWIVARFGALPARPTRISNAGTWVQLDSVVSIEMVDRVHRPRTYVAWATPPLFQGGDAKFRVLAPLLESRLWKGLVMERRLAYGVEVRQHSRAIASQFRIAMSPRPGVRSRELVEALDSVLGDLDLFPPTAAEMAAAATAVELQLIRELETAGGRAELMNLYSMLGSGPGELERDVARTRDVSPSSIRETARLLGPARVILTVIPARSGDDDFHASGFTGTGGP